MPPGGCTAQLPSRRGNSLLGRPKAPLEQPDPAEPRAALLCRAPEQHFPNPNLLHFQGKAQRCLWNHPALQGEIKPTLGPGLAIPGTKLCGKKDGKTFVLINAVGLTGRKHLQKPSCGTEGSAPARNSCHGT